MRRNLAFTLLVVSLGGCGEVAQPITLHAPNQIGNAIDLEMRITLVEHFTKDEKVIKYQAVPIRLEVIDIDSGIAVEWITGSAGPAKQPRLDLALIIAEDQAMEFILGKDSQPTVVQNLSELMKSAASAIDRLEESLPNDKANHALISRFRQSCGDPTSVEPLIRYRPNRYFLPYGWTLKPGQPISINRDLVTKYSESPLPTTITVELNSFTPTDQHYVVHFEQAVDQERLPASMKLNGQRGGILGLLDSSPRFELTVEGDFKINRSTGWVEEAKVTKSVTSNEQTHREIIEFSGRK